MLLDLLPDALGLLRESWVCLVADGRSILPEVNMMLGRRDLVELPLKHGALLLKQSHETISKELILEMEKTQTLTPVLQFIFLIIVYVFWSSAWSMRLFDGFKLNYFGQRFVHDFLLILGFSFSFSLYSLSNSLRRGAVFIASGGLFSSVPRSALSLVLLVMAGI